MSQLEPYLFFDGNCAEAMRFYEKALGGKLEMMMKASEAPAGAGCPAPLTNLAPRCRCSIPNSSCARTGLER